MWWAFPSIDRSLGKSDEPTMATDQFLRGIEGQKLFSYSRLSVLRPCWRWISSSPERQRRLPQAARRDGPDADRYAALEWIGSGARLARPRFDAQDAASSFCAC